MSALTNVHPNHNYRVGTDVLPSGKVKATAHGRKTNTRTFPEGTTPADAAAQLAAKLEGERFSHVTQHSGHGHPTKADWTVLVGEASA